MYLFQPFYIGGVRDYRNAAVDSGVTQGFSGAIQKLIINGLALDDIREGVTDMVNIEEYRGKPWTLSSSSSSCVCVCRAVNDDGRSQLKTSRKYCAVST
jgi:hypothetical protein